jgi:predicted RNA-binding protein with PUA-like domain
MEPGGDAEISGRPLAAGPAKTGVTGSGLRATLSPMQYWLVKQEPEAYGWAAFADEGRTAWTGVRNLLARNNLRAMKKGDRVFYYHSGEEKQVVGLARVEQAAYPDPTATEGDWSCVDLAPVRLLKRPVTLAAIKSDPALKDLPMVKQSRLSVSPVTERQFARILELAATPAP